MFKSISVVLLVSIMGCGASLNTQSIQQCDELYISDYNCVIPQNKTFYIQPNPYNSYYPNTQTIYYVPVYIPQPNIEQERPVRVGPRPNPIIRNTDN